MNKIIDLIPRLEESQKTPSANDSVNSPERPGLRHGLKTLMKMQTLYPQKFKLVYADTEAIDEAAKLWDKHLNDFSFATLTRAWNDCIDKFAWPPELSEFKALCKSYGDKGRPVQSSASHDYAVRQSVKNQDPETKSLIDKGAVVCKLIKAAYPDLNWWQVANIFTKAKVQGRKMFPNDSEADVIDKLALFSKEDFYDVHPQANLKRVVKL